MLSGDDAGSYVDVSFSSSDAGDDAEELVCSPGASRCVDMYSLETCASDGIGWLAATDCGDGMVCSGSTCIQASCAPAIVFLTDRSSSMEDNWDQVRSSVASVIAQHPSYLYGLVAFPNASDACDTSSDWARVSVATSNGETIDDWFADNPDTYRSTPLVAVLEWIVDNTDEVWGDAGTAKYLVVISDGNDSCACSDSGSSDSDCVTSALAEATSSLNEAGVLTYVIGFHFSGEPEELNTIAENGGTAWTSYVEAGSEEELTDAFGFLLDDFKLCVNTGI